MAALFTLSASAKVSVKEKFHILPDSPGWVYYQKAQQTRALIPDIEPMMEDYRKNVHRGAVLCPRMKAFSDAVQGLAPCPLLRRKVSPCCGPLDDIHEDCAVATAASTWW